MRTVLLLPVALLCLPVQGLCANWDCLCRVLMFHGDSEKPKELGRFKPEISEDALTVKTFPVAGSDRLLAAYFFIGDPPYRSFATDEGMATITVVLRLAWGKADQRVEKKNEFRTLERTATAEFAAKDSEKSTVAPLWVHRVHLGDPALQVRHQRADFVLECELRM